LRGLIIHDVLHDLGTAGQHVGLHQRGLIAGELILHPSARIGDGGIAGPGAKAETVQCNQRRGHRHGDCPVVVPVARLRGPLSSCRTGIFMLLLL
jgi:hypothetical protein